MPWWGTLLTHESPFCSPWPLSKGVNWRNGSVWPSWEKKASVAACWLCIILHWILSYRLQGSLRRLTPAQGSHITHRSIGLYLLLIYMPNHTHFSQCWQHGQGLRDGWPLSWTDLFHTHRDTETLWAGINKKRTDLCTSSTSYEIMCSPTVQWWKWFLLVKKI